MALTMGFTTGTTQYGSESIFSEDAIAGAPNSVTYQRDTGLAVIVRESAANIVKMITTLVSFDTDGFTVHVTADAAQAYLVHYLALGGSDLTNA